jgi:uncharacterized protein (TIGR02466 family)
MSPQFIEIFPTLIYRVENFLSINQCKKIEEFARNLSLNSHQLFVGDGLTTYGNKGDSCAILDIGDSISECNNLETLVNWQLKEYSKKSGIRQTYSTNSWISVQSNNSKLEMHTHPNSIITGVIYIKVDKNSSNLKLINPNPFTTFTPIKNMTHYTTPWYKIIPEIGDLYLFPSWLSHGSDNINLSDERIIISFNSQLQIENI